MAISGGAVPSGGKRSLDAEINLVPFIDLLSMCICFLLITAVWIQVGSVQVKQSRGTEAAAAAETLDLAIKFSSPTELELTAQKGSKVVKRAVVKAASPEMLAKEVGKSLGMWISSYGATSGSALFGSAMLTPNQGVSYGNLVQVMDALRGHQIVNLGVVPVKF